MHVPGEAGTYLAYRDVLVQGLRARGCLVRSEMARHARRTVLLAAFRSKWKDEASGNTPTSEVQTGKPLLGLTFTVADHALILVRFRAVIEVVFSRVLLWFLLTSAAVYSAVRSVWQHRV